MDPPPSDSQASAPVHIATDEPDSISSLRQLVSQIDTESRMQEVVDKAKDLTLEETQLLVDCLSMALDKNAVPAKNRSYIWRSIIKVASSAKIFSRNHTLDPNQITSEGATSPGSYRILGKPSTRLKVLKTVKKGSDALYDESLVSWVHLSHPNILPLYAIFLEGDNDVSLVFPQCTTNGNICDYADAHPTVPRMPLVSDVINGLHHIHQLDLVHGELSPESVVVSDDGRALITELDPMSELRESGLSSARYSAPELLREDDIQPTKATDVWSFACLCYEVLSGKVPFYQITREFRVSGAVVAGAKPIRLGQGEVGGDEISDAMWQLLLKCWEYEPNDRPVCSTILQLLSGIDIPDHRSEAKSLIKPEIAKGSTIDFANARARLTRVLGPNQPTSVRVPQHLHHLVLRLISNPTKFEATAAAANKLSPNDMQCLIDFLDLAVDGLPRGTHPDRSILTLMSKIMMSTYIFPQSYRLNGVQYDPASAAEARHGAVYKGRGINIRIDVLKESDAALLFLRGLSRWSRFSHPNILPLYGVFLEDTSKSPQICVVTPLLNNGNLRDYALTLPQRSRMPLISDVINGLSYLHKSSINYSSPTLRGETVLITDTGRAVLLGFGMTEALIAPEATTSTSKLRFRGPNFVGGSTKEDIWSFGCLYYEVLSRKLPYYQYEEDHQVRAAISAGELPRRPNRADGDMDEIDDKAWDLITKCCRPWRGARITAQEVQELLANMIEDNRPYTTDFPGVDILALRSSPDLDFHRVENLLDQIQVELLREPLSDILRNRINDVAVAVAGVGFDDTRVLVDFLDLVLKNRISISAERNRVLALLSKVTASTRIFPQRYQVKGIKYHPTPVAEGGFGTVHQGSDPTVCVKVMMKVDEKSLAVWVRELILWAHASHPNILPFYGVMLESDHNSQRICLVSPFMKNGNLHDYASRLPQKSRLPLILDVVNGLQYIHELGIVHSDLKGPNVLISNEGRALITDFGASHIITATAAPTSSSIFSTLRFAAPEVVLGGEHWQPTKESDIWSFGCLCYETLSRRTPYYQYKLPVQVNAALTRKELPKRPIATKQNDADEASEMDDLNWDEEDDENWDTIDDQTWGLITRCCAPEPEDRPKIPGIQELIADMKIWDDRPAAKATSGVDVFKPVLDPEINLSRVGELFEKVREVVAPLDSSDDEENPFNLFNSL
ncbi:hypothetical protein D9756_002541 [Leucocoprinus leucothites]|uniref:Protein kinase domain-containing protein n=1 Tax=Leucocoprinus leucothites TaxID=201217 RepID=A0A8H5GC18_9AGAR|nr:hypothetical protein D9756_002541 [Leucoagaricus leucothites]